VLGAGGRVARATALRLSAHGAAVVAAGPVLSPVLETAGLVAAAGGVARVVETPAPPLLGAELLAAAGGTIEPVSDVGVSPEAVPSRAEAEATAAALGRALPPGGRVWVLDAARRPVDEAERVAQAFLAGVDAAGA
jgi:hypothetical protein